MDDKAIGEVAKYAGAIGLFIVLLWKLSDKLFHLAQTSLTKKLKKYITIGGFFFLFVWGSLVVLRVVGILPNQTPNESAKQGRKPSFRIEPEIGIGIVRAVAESTAFEYSKVRDVDYVVKIAHTGEVEPVEPIGNAIYRGGSIGVSVNGVLCDSLPNSKLPSWPDNPGNPRKAIENNLDQFVARYCADHELELSLCITRCIHGN